MNFKDVIHNIKSRFEPIDATSYRSAGFPPPGLYHYTREQTGEKSRIHLRIEPDKMKTGSRGLLLINANRVLHLNPSAALMAFLVLEQYPQDQALQLIKRNYRVSTSHALEDYAQFTLDLNDLLSPTPACPVCDLNVEVTTPFSTQPLAPYRMDLAVTYRCNNDCSHCYNARQRDFPELSTEQWKSIINRLWEVGIPHIVFTGGEPTLRNDLPDLIQHAEHVGMITGLNTNGRRLSDQRYLKQLVDAGLDHVQITIESHEASIHDAMVASSGAWRQTISGLKNTLDTPLFVMTNTTMLEQNSPYLAETLSFFASVGVPTIGLNALIYSGRGASVGTGLSENDLHPLLNLAREITDRHSQRLIWYTPTQYCNFDPMELDLGVKGCTAALYNMCIEPDGGVIPCQSYYHQLGNILTDNWTSIWEHELSISLRERHYLPEKCHECSLLRECGGGCPLYLDISNNRSHS
jgi:radical SAM protein with 4Fe4S-binding SPASM domain